MKYLYRNNEVGFKKWASKYIVEAKKAEYLFPKIKYRNELMYKKYLKEYEEALIILNEYESFLLLLNEEELEIFNRGIVKSEIIDDINKNRVFLIKQNLLEKWQKVCFKNNKHRIKKVNNKELGNELRKIRIENGLSVSAVSNVLNINQSTLRNYELGYRVININVLYGLSQIYKISIEKLIK